MIIYLWVRAAGDFADSVFVRGDAFYAPSLHASFDTISLFGFNRAGVVSKGALW